MSALGLNPQYRFHFQHVFLLLSETQRIDKSNTSLARPLRGGWPFLLPTFGLPEAATQWTNASFGYFELLEF